MPTVYLKHTKVALNCNGLKVVGISSTNTKCDIEPTLNYFQSQSIIDKVNCQLVSLFYILKSSNLTLKKYLIQ